MKLSNVTIEQYTTTDRATGKPAKRWRARWRVYPPSGKPRMCKRSGFRTKGNTDVFVETLRKSEFGGDGWHLDDRGYPVAPSVQQGPTVLETAATYVAMKWATEWGAGSRGQNRNRLLVVVACLVDDPAAVEGIISGLDSQRLNRGVRPEPTTREGWVARYLRDYALDPTIDVNSLDLCAGLSGARAWIEQHSMPVHQIDDERLLVVRRHLVDGRRASTARSYWKIVSAYLAWLVRSGRLDRNPAAGMPPIRRDPRNEVVDADRVPTETEVWQIAELAGQRYGPQLEVLVVLLYFGALRISEAIGLSRGDITPTANGGVKLRVEIQENRIERRYSDDKDTTVQRKATKGRTTGPSATRTVYIPARAAGHLLRYLENTVGDQPDAAVFCGVRGGTLNVGWVRRERWDPLIAGLFDAAHRLHGLVFHDLRHGGMTLWLRCGVSLKLCQAWGGWHSLKVMLDVYAAVLPDDFDDAVAALEEGGGDLGTTGP